ncbi:hypothetical protein [Paenibacillus sp. NPDC055715]
MKKESLSILYGEAKARSMILCPSEEAFRRKIITPLSVEVTNQMNDLLIQRELHYF